MRYLLIFFILNLFNADSEIKLDTSKSKLKITGTSSLHDWEMNVNQFDAIGDISSNTISDLLVTVKSKSMRSGKSVMDKKAYDAVQEAEYPNILFRAKSLQILDNKISGPGILEIAGKSKELDFQADILSDDDQEMRLQGKVALKMTDFDIEPPTAVFGTLKTGDEVVINYDIYLNKN